MPNTTIEGVTQVVITPISDTALRVLLTTPDSTVTASVTASISLPPSPPDLIVTSIAMTPDAPVAGDSVRFRATVMNQGGTGTPVGTIIGVRFDVNNAIATWSDNYTAGLLANTSTTLAANGGPGGNGGLWQAVAGTFNLQAWVDDVNRIPAETPKTNNTLVRQFTVTPSTTITASVTTSITIPGGSTIVGDLSSLQTALNRGDLDVTLINPVTAPNNGVNIPRISGGRTFRCSGNGIITRGSPSGHVLRSDGSGGRLTLVGVRVDGGWRSNPHEAEDSESNYMLGDFAFLRIDGCVTCYSLRTGFNVGGCDVLEIVNSTIFANPRDAVWEPGVRDYLFENNLVQHCGDDSWGSHQGDIGNNLVTKSIIVRNNRFRDGFGFKAHAGAASGTHNGKPSQILIENNTFEAGGLYGLYFWEDFGNGEPWAPPRNIIIRNNSWANIRTTTRSSGGQRIGVAVLLGFPDTNYDASLVISNNTFTRNAAFNGQPLQNCYNWGVPAGVPGGPFTGFFSKNGFQSGEVFELASTGFRTDGGSGSFTHSGNVWVGSWNSTLS